MITAIKSKYGQTYKFKIEASIRGDRIYGETLSFRMDLYDAVSMREAASILEGRLFRGEYGQVVTPYQRNLVKEALLTEMLRIKAENS